MTPKEYDAAEAKRLEAEAAAQAAAPVVDGH